MPYRIMSPHSDDPSNFDGSHYIPSDIAGSRPNNEALSADIKKWREENKYWEIKQSIKRAWSYFLFAFTFMTPFVVMALMMALKYSGWAIVAGAFGSFIAAMIIFATFNPYR